MRTEPLFAVLLLFPFLCFGADFWSPVNPEELNLKTPKVQKDAAAEVLFWETKLLHARNYSDTFRVELPDGFTVDELPTSGKLESAYGTFKMTVKADGNAILVTRALELKSITAPAADYAKVREFFATIAGAESQPVVLAKK